MKQQIEKMYSKICKKYGVDQNLTLKDFESVTITPCVKAKKAKD